MCTSGEQSEATLRPVYPMESPVQKILPIAGLSVVGHAWAWDWAVPGCSRSAASWSNPFQTPLGTGLPRRSDHGPSVTFNKTLLALNVPLD